MANYAVDDYVTQTGTPEEVAAWMETRLELLNTSSGIHLIATIPQGKGKVKGVIIHDTMA